MLLEEAVTVTETKFLMSTETYSEILEIAEQFKDSIKRAIRLNHMKTCTRKDPRRAHKMVDLQKVITRHKKPCYIKIVGRTVVRKKL